MSLLKQLFDALRDSLVDTATDTEERYLADATDHADLERRIAVQSRAYMWMAPMNIGR